MEARQMTPGEADAMQYWYWAYHYEEWMKWYPRGGPAISFERRDPRTMAVFALWAMAGKPDVEETQRRARDKDLFSRG